MGLLCSLEVCSIENADPLGGLWRKVVRPKRDEYDIDDLGPTKFRIKGKTYKRKDFQLVNDRGHKLECSYFGPHSRRIGRSLPAEAKEPLPCVVYLHGATSSRREALFLRSFLLPRGISLVSLDQSGSGLSGGDYVSFGHHEERDLQAVLKHLRESGDVSAVALWGRSMGAAASVLRASEDHSLAAVVLDSPFSSLPAAVRELASKSVPGVPMALLDMTIRRIRCEIKTHAQFDLEDVLPIQSAPWAKSPAIFAVGESDDVVLPYHVRALHEAWGGGDCRLITLSGGHNTVRPTKFVEEACDFLLSRLTSAAAEQASQEQQELSDNDVYDFGVASRRISATSTQATSTRCSL